MSAWTNWSTRIILTANFPYRKLLAVVDFEKLYEPIHDLDNAGRSGAHSYGIVTLFQCLLLQFIEDISEVFTFVDATHLIIKANLWQERDKVLAQGYEKLNNKTPPKAACDKDRWISSIRSPFERMFSRSRKRVRYRSRVKNQFAAFMGAKSFNFKRLLVLRCQPLWPLPATSNKDDSMNQPIG